MDCERQFTVIQTQRLLRPVKWKQNMFYMCVYKSKTQNLIHVL